MKQWNADAAKINEMDEATFCAEQKLKTMNGTASVEGSLWSDCILGGN